MKVLVNISVTDDDILEGNEKFLVMISYDSLSNNKDLNIVIGNITQGTRCIKKFEFEKGSRDRNKK